MKNILILIIYLLVLNIYSCDQNNSKKGSQKQNKKGVTDVKNYTGNAFIFNDPKTFGARCFIIPVEERDSSKFINLNVEQGIIGRVCIQIFFGRPDLLKLVNDKRKERIDFKACNLPQDSMFFSRAFVSYKNCVEIKKSDNNENDADSCNSKMVDRTDSTEGYFRIYQ